MHVYERRSTLGKLAFDDLRAPLAMRRREFSFHDNDDPTASWRLKSKVEMKVSLHGFFFSSETTRLNLHLSAVCSARIACKSRTC